LIELIADQTIDVPLYWHHWRNGGELLNALTQHVQRHAATRLVAAIA